MAATPRMVFSLGKLRLAFYPSGLPDLGQPQVGPARSHVTGNSSHTAALASSPALFGHAVSTPSSLDPLPHLSNLQVKREMASDKQGREEARSCPAGSVGKRPNRTHDKIQGTRGSQALLEVYGQWKPESTGRGGGPLLSWAAAGAPGGR